MIMSQSHLKIYPRRLSLARIATIAIAIIVYWWAVRGTEVSLTEFIRGLPGIWNLLQHMFPPDLKILKTVGGPVIETLQIGILSTIIGSLIAFPMGFLAAANTSPHRFVYILIRAILNVFRGVSEIIWGLIFVVALGLGSFPGVIALVIFCVGTTGKLLAEAVEAVDPGPLEAIRSTGASNWKVFLYGVWPQVIPIYLSYCLYYWDHNTRQATILGFVGAGGVGYTLFVALSMYEFEQATTIIIVMVLVITLIDRFCWFLRRRII
jgi:phosphonate transport system permease protein